MEDYFTTLSAMNNQIPDDKLLWLSFKRVWKQIWFSLIHHKRNKLEVKDEYYQALYESAYIIWLENALVSDQPHRLEHTCILIFTWFCLVHSYKDTGLASANDLCLQINMSAKILNAIMNHLATRHDSYLSSIKVTQACLKRLKEGHNLNFSIEIGVKTVNITQNLNPRSQII